MKIHPILTQEIKKKNLFIHLFHPECEGLSFFVKCAPEKLYSLQLLPCQAMYVIVAFYILNSLILCNYTQPCKFAIKVHYIIISLKITNIGIILLILSFKIKALNMHKARPCPFVLILS